MGRRLELGIVLSSTGFLSDRNYLPAIKDKSLKQLSLRYILFKYRGISIRLKYYGHGPSVSGLNDSWISDFRYLVDLFTYPPQKSPYVPACYRNRHTYRSVNQRASRSEREELTPEWPARADGYLVT